MGLTTPPTHTTTRVDDTEYAEKTVFFLSFLPGSLLWITIAVQKL